MTSPFVSSVHNRLLFDRSSAARCRTARRIYRSSLGIFSLLFVHGVSLAQDAPKPASEPASSEQPAGAAGAPEAKESGAAAAPQTPSAPETPPPASPEAESAPAAKGAEAEEVSPPPAADEAADDKNAETSADSEGDSDDGATADEEEEEEEEVYDGPGTLLGGSDDKIAFGGYGGVTVLGTSIERRAALLVGGEAAFLIDHRFAIGVGGYGLASEVSGPTFANGDGSALGFGYGGGILRYHFVGERSPLGLSIGALVGGGGLTHLRKLGEDDFEYDIEQDEPDAFFVVEPSVQGHLYLTRWMRLGINGSYRFVSGVNSLGLQDSDLAGFAFGGHLQFGWF